MDIASVSLCCPHTGRSGPLRYRPAPIPQNTTRHAQPRPRGPTVYRLLNLCVLTDHSGDRPVLHTRLHSHSKPYTCWFCCAQIRGFVMQSFRAVTLR